MSRTIDTLPSDLSGATRELLQAIHRETHQVALAAAQASTPIGGDAKDYRGGRSPGQMRASWRSQPASIDSAIAALQPTKIEDTAPAVVIINRGRKKSDKAWYARNAGAKGVGAGGHGKSGRKHTKKDSASYHLVHAGKLLGSAQAPFGIKGPVLRELAAQKEAIFARSVAIAEAKAGTP